MKVLKNVLKIFGIIFFIVITAILILYNIFFVFMGCYITINNNNTILETLLEEEKIDKLALVIPIFSANSFEDIFLFVSILSKFTTIISFSILYKYYLS